MRVDKCKEMIQLLTAPQTWELVKCFSFDSQELSTLKIDNFKNEDSWKVAVSQFISLRTEEIFLRVLINRLYEDSVYFEKWRN